MSSRFVMFLLLPVLGMLSQLPADDGAAPLLRDLVVKEEITLPGDYQSARFLIAFKCNGDGEVFGRLYSNRDTFRTPILKFRPDGSPIQYSITNVPVETLLKKGGTLDYFVARGGEVHQIAQVERTYEIYLLSWERDGSFRSATRLDARFNPGGPLAVFPSGEILVSGFVPHDSDRPYYTAVNMLFDKNGKLLKEVELKGDKYDPEHTTAPEDVQAENRKVKSAAVSLGGALVGADGNLYLMRRSSPGVIFVISASGELVRTLEVDIGDPQLLPAKLVEHEGRLALLFYNSDQSMVDLLVVDSQSGQQLERYSVRKPLGPALACFGKQGFTFFSSRGRQIVLQRAAPR